MAETALHALQRIAPLAAVVAAHLALLAALLAHPPTRDTMVQFIPVMVNLLPGRAEPAAKPAQPQKAAPKPKPPREEQARPAPAATVQTVATPSPPSPLITSSSAASTSAAPAPSAPSTPSTPSTAQSITAPQPSAAPLPFTPPRVDAAYLDNPKPEYPVASLRLGEAGRVVLSVAVSAAGSVDQASVRTSSGSERLDQAALKAVRQWKFIPARRGAEAVAAQVLVPIVFKPENE